MICGGNTRDFPQVFQIDRTYCPFAMDSFSTLSLLESPNWQDYELMDSGDGRKLERFGAFRLDRPDVQAIWKPVLSKNEWSSAHAVFESTGEESGGHWVFRKKMPQKWEMRYPLMNSLTHPIGKGEIAKDLRFWAMTTPGRHLGVFPETSSHWDCIAESVQRAGASRSDPIKILNLFAYTGLSTLAAAAAGAHVTHLDASRKSVQWARENQTLSQLDDKPVRWIIDDALKFVEREGRRGARYDGIILDPPKFGRGPKGEVWEVYKSLPRLMQACSAILSETPLFVMVTAYAVKVSAVHIAQALQGVLGDHKGRVEAGELVTREKSGQRLLSQAVFARWWPD